MLFCPTCANLLLIEQSSNEYRFFCKTCPYIFPVQYKIENKVHLKRKQVDDVLGGKDSWANVAQTDARCPNCPNRKAFFKQIQMRSADEPMTEFYKCTQCSHLWSER